MRAAYIWVEHALTTCIYYLTRVNVVWKKSICRFGLYSDNKAWLLITYYTPCIKDKIGGFQLHKRVTECMKAMDILEKIQQGSCPRSLMQDTIDLSQLKVP